MFDTKTLVLSINENSFEFDVEFLTQFSYFTNFLLFIFSENKFPYTI